MKKVMAMGIVLVLWMATSAWADSPWCTVCPTGKTTVCAVDEMCPAPEQTACDTVNPCNAIIEICECVDPNTGTTIFRENNAIGIKITSNTPGVYFRYDAAAPLQVQLYAEDDLDGACDARTLASLPDPAYEWDPVNSLYYLDGSGDPIEVEDDVDPCDPQEIVTISTCVGKDQLAAGPDYPSYWVIDYLTTDRSLLHPTDGDNDFDGEEGEDLIGYYGHLVITMPEVAVDWDAVDDADLGTIATATVTLIQLEDLDSLCPSCNEICACEVPLVELCPTDTPDTHCIYFPYALYQVGKWETGLAITNTSEGSVAAEDMSVEITIVDSLGNVTTATYADFTSPIQSFSVNGLIDSMLDLEGEVAEGNIYIKFEANFPIDGYEFNYVLDGDLSFGAGTLARDCDWPSCD